MNALIRVHNQSKVDCPSRTLPAHTVYAYAVWNERNTILDPLPADHDFDRFNPLTAGAAYIRVCIFISTLSATF